MDSYSFRDRASAPNAHNLTPITLNPPQLAPPTQPAEASASSQVTSSIPKPPNWGKMTVTQKRNWNRAH